MKKTRWTLVPFPVQDLCSLLNGKQRFTPLALLLFIFITVITTTAYRRQTQSKLQTSCEIGYIANKLLDTPREQQDVWKQYNNSNGSRLGNIARIAATT